MASIKEAADQTAHRAGEAALRTSLAQHPLPVGADVATLAAARIQSRGAAIDAYKSAYSVAYDKAVDEYFNHAIATARKG